MADIFYNNGQPKDVIIAGDYDHTKLYVSASISVDDSVKIAGHSIVNLNGDGSIEDVQFKNHELDYSFKLYGKLLTIVDNVSKFKMVQKNIKGQVDTAKCTVTIEAGDDLIGSYELDDSAHPEANSVFIYYFMLTKQ